MDDGGTEFPVDRDLTDVLAVIRGEQRGRTGADKTDRQCRRCDGWRHAHGISLRTVSGCRRPSTPLGHRSAQLSRPCRARSGQTRRNRPFISARSVRSSHLQIARRGTYAFNIDLLSTQVFVHDQSSSVRADTSVPEGHRSRAHRRHQQACSAFGIAGKCLTLLADDRLAKGPGGVLPQHRAYHARCAQRAGISSPQSQRVTFPRARTFIAALSATQSVRIAST